MVQFRDKDRQELVELLLRDFETSKRIKADGSVSFKGDFAISEWRIVIGNCMRFSGSVPHWEVESLIWAALVDCGAKGKIDWRAFVSALSKAEKQYLRKPLKRYVMWTEISINPSDKLPGARTNGVSVSFPTSLPRRFRVSRQRLVKAAEQTMPLNHPTGYRLIRASVMERSDKAAIDRCLDEIDLLRGIWNLGLNYGRGMPIGIGVRKSINQVVLGPFHTVHLHTGKEEREHWWYELDSSAMKRPLHLGPQVGPLMKFTAWTRRRLKALAYGQALCDWIRQYSRALDDRNYSTGFLQLWQVIEAACGNPRESKVTARRAARIYRDSEVHTRILVQIAELRNDVVHQGRGRQKAEDQVHIAKYYAEGILLYHLRYGNRFKDRLEASAFLDLPNDAPSLERRRCLLNMAIRLHT